GDGANARQPPARQETVHARDDPIPVTQQVEHHDRNQREIDENAEDDRASRLQARQELESQRLCAVEVVRDQLLDRSQVDLQLDAEGLAQPGCKPAVEVGGELGKAAHELPDLALDQRYENDQQREHQQQNDEYHEQSAERARHAMAFRPDDEGAAEIGEDRADQKRRQNRPEEMQQRRDHDRGDYEPQV